MRLPLTNIEQRLWLPLMTALLVSNVNGALIVTLFLVYLLPLPELNAANEELRTNEILRANLTALAVFWAATLPIGALWMMRKWRPVRLWLATGQPARRRDRIAVLRAPRRVMLLTGLLWTGAMITFALINSHYSWRLSLSVAIAILIGGLGTSIFAYLTVQRILRPLAALVLAEDGHDRPEAAGVTTRIMLSWGLGTAMPLLGVVLVGIGVMTDSQQASLDQMAAVAVFLGGTAIITGAITMWIGTRSLSEPLSDLRKQMERVREADYEARVSVYDASEVGLLQTGFNEMVAGLAERERLRDLFDRQVGPEVVEHGLERGAGLGGEERFVAVLFCDMVGSTQLATQHPPAEVVEILNRFFAVIVDVVTSEGGTVNKFLGDAGLCTFGAPAPHTDAAGAALRSALRIQARLRRELPGYEAGVGVSAGQVVAGYVGSAERFEYTVIGDAVNEAARLTDLAKRERDGILISESALAAAPAVRGRWEKAGRERLRGRAEPTEVFRPVAGGEGQASRSRIPAIRVLPHRSRSDGGGTR